MDLSTNTLDWEDGSDSPAVQRTLAQISLMLSGLLAVIGDKVDMEFISKLELAGLEQLVPQPILTLTLLADPLLLIPQDVSTGRQV